MQVQCLEAIEPRTDDITSRPHQNKQTGKPIGDYHSLQRIQIAVLKRVQRDDGVIESLVTLRELRKVSEVEDVPRRRLGRNELRRFEIGAAVVRLSFFTSATPKKYGPSPTQLRMT